MGDRMTLESFLDEVVKENFPDNRKVLRNWYSFLNPLSTEPDVVAYTVNPLPDVPIPGSSSSAGNKVTKSKIWTNGDTII